jgi:hypothetical protein
MRCRYRELDENSMIGVVIAERVAAGQLADPSSFALEGGRGGQEQGLVNSAEKAPSAHEAPVGSTMIEMPTEEDEKRRRDILGVGGL